MTGGQIIFNRAGRCLGTAALAAMLFAAPLRAEAYKPRRSEIVKAFMYHPDSRVLTLYYYDGKKINYQGVPESIYKGLVKAPLKGGYVKAFIRGHFPES